MMLQLHFQKKQVCVSSLTACVCGGGRRGWWDLDGNAEFYEVPLWEVTGRERNEQVTLPVKRL